jgi:WD40 repeat protein
MFIRNKQATLTFQNATDLECFAQNDNLLAVGTQSKEIRVTDLKTMGPPAGLTSFISTGAQTPTALAFVTATKIAVVYQGSSTAQIFNLSTGALTSLSAASIGPKYRLNGLAANISSGVAFHVTSTTGNVVRIDSTGGTSATLSPAWASGKVMFGVIHKPGSSNFLFACNDGTIREVDSAGTTLVSTITARTLTSEVGSRTLVPETMAMIGDNLFVGTTQGVLLHIKFSTDTLLDKRIISRPVNITSVTTDRPVIGLGFPAGNLLPVFFPQFGETAQNIALYAADSYPIIEVDSLASDQAIYVLGSGVNQSADKFWVSFGQGQVSVYDCPCQASLAEDTRIQDPVGLDVAGRILRIPMYPGMRQRKVESDTDIDDEETSIDYNLDNCEYLEVALTGTEFSTEKGSARIFEG